MRQVFPAEGIYLVKQASRTKPGDHAAVLFAGPRLAPRGDTLLELSPKGVGVRPAVGTSEWRIEAQVVDEQAALARIRAAASRGQYSLPDNNCEHFAYEVVTGKRQSPQVAGVVIVAGLVGLAILAGRA